jgi:dTMP kinase
MLISFEGVDGAGKTTQISMLATWLRVRGHRVDIVRFPGQTSMGRQIRSLLLQPTEISPTAELLLFAADFARTTTECIVPALAAGRIVLCDRFAASTIAYQGYGRGLNLAAIRQILDLATGGLVPDLAIWLDLPAEKSYGRADPHSRIATDKAFYDRVGEGYASDPSLVRVDATLGIIELHDRLCQVVQLFSREL